MGGSVKWKREVDHSTEAIKEKKAKYHINIEIR